MAVDHAALRKVRFLEPLSDREIRKLAGSMTERTAAAGNEVVEQKEQALAFFAILDGTAIVSVDGREVRRLQAGDHFGEIGLIVPSARRTATVRAATDVRLGAMSSWNFKAFVAEHPEVTWPLLVTLATRVAGESGE